MSLSAQPIGPYIDGDDIHFALWAPDATDVSLILPDANRPMQRNSDGWYHTTVNGKGPGLLYSYLINQSLAVPDPASRFQPEGVFGPSQVTASRYSWSDEDWNGLPWIDAVIWEGHVGTATPEGTFQGLMARLPELRRTGYTAIQLMPIAQFAGTRNWGYDGVLPFAPACVYGHPDDLRALVDAAHRQGLMVFLDVVYNHFGPAGNFLPQYASAFFTDRHRTPWGQAINFDGPSSETVRQFYLRNAIYWIDEFHIDGLRIDAAHAILDDSREHFLALLSRTLNDNSRRRVHLILENENNDSRWLAPAKGSRHRPYSAQWNDDFHHCWHVLLTGASDGYYSDFARDTATHLARVLSEGFAWQGEHCAFTEAARGTRSGHLPPQAFIAHLQTHDQIGNRAHGERLAGLADPDHLIVARAVHLLIPQTPMMFMGEEWNSSTPFQYFVDFANDPVLEDAVRRGRQQEFQNFKDFSDASEDTPIPDPTSPQPFHASKLDWNEAGRPTCKSAYDLTVELLQIRKMHITPLAGSGWIDARIDSMDPIDIVWRYSSGSLRLILNLSSQDRSLKFRPSECVIWSSFDTDLKPELMPGWSAAFSITSLNNAGSAPSTGGTGQ